MILLKQCTSQFASSNRESNLSRECSNLTNDNNCCEASPVMSTLNFAEPIIIVGGGTFGTSTAYHLAQRGYKSVTVLDRWVPPSKDAAGNDINKIVRTEYPQPHYAKLAQDSAAVWKDEKGLFAGLYHQTGWILSVTESTMDFIDGSIQAQRRLGLPEAKPVTSQQMRQRWPEMTGNFPGWRPYWNETTAWVDAGGAVKRMAEAAMTMGVKYISGDQGHAVKLLFDESSQCIGVKCFDGTAHFGSQIIVAAGAAAAGLLDLKGQIVGKGHTVCHIQLTPEEVKKYTNFPITSHMEGGESQVCLFKLLHLSLTSLSTGILFPPQRDGIMKVTANSFYTNYAPSHPNISVPRYTSDNPKDGVPRPTIAAIREWMREFVPELADREFCETKFCWYEKFISTNLMTFNCTSRTNKVGNRDGDTPDYEFLIAPSPDHKGLKLAVGGSAHGFKFLPVVGRYVVDMMEGHLDPELADKWKWRPGATMNQPTACPLPLVDLNDLPGWKPAAKL